MKHFVKLLVVLCTFLCMLGCPNDQDPQIKKRYDISKVKSLQSVIDAAKETEKIDLSKYKYLEDYKAIIDKQITLLGDNRDFKNADVIVSADGVDISGISNAVFTASSKLGNGSLKISNSSLSSLTINGGGINSIYVLDTSVDNILVNKQLDSYRDEYVRVVYNENTKFNQLRASSDFFLYYDGSDDNFTHDLSKITIDNSVDVALNKSYTNLSDEEVVVEVSLMYTKETMKFVLNAGNIVKENFFTDVATKISDRITFNKIVDADDKTVQIDFSEQIKENKKYIEIQKDHGFFIIPDCSSKKFYLCDSSVDEVKSLPLSGKISHLFTTQIQDNDGNVFMIYNGGLDDKPQISLLGLSYKQLYLYFNGLIKEPECSIKMLLDGSLINATNLDNMYIRLALFEKGKTKHLFVLYDLLSNDNSGIHQPFISCYDIIEEKKVDVTEFSVNLLGSYSFGDFDSRTYLQSIAVDSSERLYVGINSFDLEIQNQCITISDNKSSVSSYSISFPILNIGQTIPPMKMKKTNTYDTLYKTIIGDDYNSSYDFPKLSKSNYTLYDVVKNYSFGIQDIRIVDDEFFFLTENKYLNQIIDKKNPFLISQGNIIIGDPEKKGKNQKKVINNNMYYIRTGQMEGKYGPVYLGCAFFALSNINRIIVIEDGFYFDNNGSFYNENYLVDFELVYKPELHDYELQNPFFKEVSQSLYHEWTTTTK